MFNFESNQFRGADDRAAYVNLLKELRLAFEGEAKTSGLARLLLTAAVPASFEAIAAGYDVPEVNLKKIQSSIVQIID